MHMVSFQASGPYWVFVFFLSSHLTQHMKIRHSLVILAYANPAILWQLQITFFF